ncbi:MAG: Ig-like domain-containing protein [Spirochaetaceae bacterium]|jgi:hypothetical protein|nr:Ig-like domain-containing protein [Spirochaetaceae bacterium]
MNQGIKKFWFAGVAAVLTILMAAVFVLAGCENAAVPPWETNPASDAGTGRGTVSIGIAGVEGTGGVSPSAQNMQGDLMRTVHPVLTVFTKYAASFEPTTGGQAHAPVEITGGSSGEVELAEGTYTVTVTGYTLVGSTETAAAEWTEQDVVITAGGKTEKTAILGPKTGTGNGTFSYDITLAGGLVGVTSATLAVTTESGAAVEGGTVDLLAGNGQGTLTLAAGSYLAAVTVVRGTGDAKEFAGFSHEVVHIYAGLESALPAKVYDASRFSPPVSVTGVSLKSASLSIVVGESVTLAASVAPDNATDTAVTWKSSATDIATVDSDGRVTCVAVGSATITVTTKDGGKTATCAVTVTNATGTYEIACVESLAAAIAAITSADAGTEDSLKVFDLRITENIAMPGSSNNTITGNYKKVRLTGDKTISLSSTGNLIRAAANQTLVIDGPTLQGIANNENALVYIDGGTVELRSGGIKGNANTSGGGGGVYITNNGTFTMKGGTVSGNTAASGGGVYITNNGTFTMQAGTISGNTATTEGGGSGVYVLSGGIFNANGGTVSDAVVKQNEE